MGLEGLEVCPRPDIHLATDASAGLGIKPHTSRWHQDCHREHCPHCRCRILLQWHSSLAKSEALSPSRSEIVPLKMQYQIKQPNSLHRSGFAVYFPSASELGGHPKSLVCGPPRPHPSSPSCLQLSNDVRNVGGVLNVVRVPGLTQSVVSALNAQPSWKLGRWFNL